MKIQQFKYSKKKKKKRKRKKERKNGVNKETYYKIASLLNFLSIK